MFRVFWCYIRKLDKDPTAGVFYIRRNSGWRFSYRKVLLNWQTV